MLWLRADGGSGDLYIEEPLNNSSLNYSEGENKNAIFLFLPFSMACQPLKMLAHPCATKTLIDLEFP